MEPSLFRIEAPHFTAGGEAIAGHVSRVAPILSYMMDWTAVQVRDYCKQRNWKVYPVRKSDYQKIITTKHMQTGDTPAKQNPA